MKKLKVLELFSGTQSISKEFRQCGHKTLTVDFNPVFAADGNEYGIKTDLNMDILQLTKDIITNRLGGAPDVIWASPDCTTYSIAAISHHRKKEDSGNLAPTSEKAKVADKVTKKTLEIISWFPDAIYFIENPRGGLRKMSFMQNLKRYTTTYCQYGDSRMKPTDIWTNHPKPWFRKPCKNGAPCHTPAPRGSSTGTQGLKNAIERSRIPVELCQHIVDISEDFYSTSFQFLHNTYLNHDLDFIYNKKEQKIEIYVDNKLIKTKTINEDIFTTFDIEEYVCFNDLIGEQEIYIESKY